MSASYVLAFDTSNEVIAIGLGRLNAETRTVALVAHEEHAAHRASNTQLLPRIDALLSSCGVARAEIACVAVGRGPGSFTGVRIALATAKGIASALGVALVGLSTQDAIAQQVWQMGMVGSVLIASDAMRKEIYPAFYELDDQGVHRVGTDRVVKAAQFVEEPFPSNVLIGGDALLKYSELLCDKGLFLPEELWTATGEGLLWALQAEWQRGAIDPFDVSRHAPAALLPIYTRLSDAEENERVRSADCTVRDLRTGVQHQGAEAVMLAPLDRAHAIQVACLEAQLTGSDAWNASMVSDELDHADRTWWMACVDGELVGYAGALIVDGDAQILKVGVAPEMQQRGIATQLISRIAADALNLACNASSLEVRVGNARARSLYRKLGYKEIGIRPHYYSDREDACIMRASLKEVLAAVDSAASQVAGMQLVTKAACAQDARGVCEAQADAVSPLIITFETSCDETAGALIEGNGRILSDVVASQIDFHARFGGVVPEIASRKHIEAICGVAEVALEEAGDALGRAIGWRDVDAVAVTYAPGLVGALVVGVAFAKGAAWALDVPFIGVNHLEGHLFANKLACKEGEDIPLPAVASLVSGGNTLLVLIRNWHDYVILGSTIDDAVGEAFDKVAKALGLPYPGGPEISRLAEKGRADAVAFPRALLHSGDYRFSLSGLKTAVMTHIEQERRISGVLSEQQMADICASFQQAVIDVQIAKARRAIKETDARAFCLGGGVAANPALRAAYEQLCREEDVVLIMPPLAACGDNAAMIALVALERFRASSFFGLDADAEAHADLSEPY